MRIKKLLGDRILIKPLPPDTVSAGGIIIPENLQGKGQPCKGEVLMIGDDPTIRVQVGDYVMYPKNAGTLLELDREEIKLIRFIDIHAELEKV